MNYFEIINKTLIELNYAPVSAFNNLTQTEHKRLMNIINRVNKEICDLNADFYFRQIIKKITVYPTKTEYSLDINGKISKIVGQNGEYFFNTDYSEFYGNNIPKYSYSIYGSKLLVSPNTDCLRIFYSTSDFVVSDNETYKSDFEKETDTSILPDNFAERLLVNGCAYNFKQNAAHPKYVHWKQEYDKALKELLSGAKRIAGSEIVIDGGYRKL